jgi:hypothetical protein
MGCISGCVRRDCHPGSRWNGWLCACRLWMQRCSWAMRWRRGARGRSEMGLLHDCHEGGESGRYDNVLHSPSGSTLLMIDAVEPHVQPRAPR